jgi:hypothetical protein
MLLLLFSLCVFGQSIDTSMVSEVKKTKPFIRFGKRSNQLVLGLEKIFVQENLFWLSFRLQNKSSLAYPIDLFRLYIRDKILASRSSLQEIELVPLFADTITNVPARGQISFVLAIPKLTIPDNKVCLLEMFETNGGRNLFLEISNRQLFLARVLSSSVQKK